MIKCSCEVFSENAHNFRMIRRTNNWLLPLTCRQGQAGAEPQTCCPPGPPRRQGPLGDVTMGVAAPPRPDMKTSRSKEKLTFLNLKNSNQKKGRQDMQNVSKHIQKMISSKKQLTP